MTSFITDDVFCHATTSAAAMFRSCTTVWRVTSLASQTLAECGTRDYRGRAWPGLLSRSTFGANFSRALPGELLASLLVRVSWALLCAVIANGCSTQVLYSPSSWLSFLMKMQSSSDEDTDSSAPLDNNHMNQTQCYYQDKDTGETDGSKTLQAWLSCETKWKPDIAENILKLEGAR